MPNLERSSGLEVILSFNHFNELLKYCDIRYKSLVIKAIPGISDREKAVNGSVNKLSSKSEPFHSPQFECGF